MALRMLWWGGGGAVSSSSSCRSWGKRLSDLSRVERDSDDLWR